MPKTVLDPEAKANGLSYTTKYIYDALGRKTEEHQAKGSKADSSNYYSITKYTYDDAGNILDIKVKKNASAPETTLQQNTYDLLGNLITQTDANGNTTTYEYNALNKPRRITYPGDETIPENTVTFQYDKAGRLTRQTDTFGATDLYTYDNQGRQLTHTRQKTDGTQPITTSVKYDKNGNIRYETDGRGNTTEKTYDQLNRLISEITTATTADNRTTQHITNYTYDKNGNLIQEKYQVKSGTETATNTYSNVYDPLNRLIEKSDSYNVIERLEPSANSSGL